MTILNSNSNENLEPENVGLERLIQERPSQERPSQEDLGRELPRLNNRLERVVRSLALVVIVWSIGGLSLLYWTTRSQPTKFMPLVMRESESEDARRKAIVTWQAQHIPVNATWLVGNESPLGGYTLDPNLATPSSRYRGSWLLPRKLDENVSFKDRLFDLNYGVELYCANYWKQAEWLLASLVGMFVAASLCWAVPRIFPSCILLAVVGFPALAQLNQPEGTPSYLWIFPMLAVSLLLFGFTVASWWVTPQSQASQDWKELWFGIFLLAIGVTLYIALFTWGGRVRSKGLAGIGLSIGWGSYLIAVHGWRLVRGSFRKSDISV